MRDTFLPFSQPVIGDEEIAEVVDTLRSGWLTTGAKTRAFEAEFAEAFRASGALAVNSCTAALHVALAAAGIGPGDEVITSPMTFASSVNVIEHVGARPVLADVDPATLTLDPAAVARALTPRTRAIIPVHYAGHPADLDPLREIAEERKLLLLEDAAHSVPARYRGRWVGEGNSIAAFSFYATKNLTTGEGGMLTGPAEFLEKARVLSLHGLSRGAYDRYKKEGTWRYDVLYPGFKYNMTDLQAAIGRCQLRKLPAFQARRREVVQAYHRAFGPTGWFQLPVEQPYAESAWHLYVLRLESSALRIGRDAFVEELKARNIGTSVHFIPVHVHPFYRERYGWKPTDFPVAFDSFERCLSLPLDARLTDRDVSDVIEAVLEIARANRR